MSKEIVSRECKFAYHIPIYNTPHGDVHLIKETLYYSDGTKEPNIRFIKNFKRPFWVTIPSKRNHKDKKEYESLDNLMEYECTEKDLRVKIGTAIGLYNASTTPLKDILVNPYVYGADIKSTSFIKAKYREKYPNFDNTFDVAILDTEANVLSEEQELILITVMFKNEVYTVVTKDFIESSNNVKERESSLVRKYLSDKINIEEYTFHLEIAKDEMHALRLAFNKLHEWKPDLLAIWNMVYDIGKIVSICEKYKVHPKELFSDPKVPEDLRYFYFKEGSMFKITASGKRQNKKPADRWNVVYSTSSFFVVDAMCVYRLTRLSNQEESSYALDYILNKELKMGKLKFKEADAYTGLQWHKYMQEHYPIEYIVYNRFDCISMDLLDVKTSDLRSVFPTFAGLSDFDIFNSQPRLISNAMFFFLKKRGLIQGTVGSSEVDKSKEGLDSDGRPKRDILDLKNWIITLHNAFIDDSTSANCIEEKNLLTRSNVRTYVYDNDAISSYPSNLIALNISKSTTKNEIVEILDENNIPMDVDTIKKQNINCICGWTNALEYCTTMLRFPQPDDILNIYDSEYSNEL